MKYYLAIDIGASSGRHIVGYLNDNGQLITDEVYRFKNGVVEQENHLVWDVESLFNSVLDGIKIAMHKYKNIVSLSIDTWGVDYVLLNGDKEILPCYSYRDNRAEEVIDKVHSIISFESLYSKTGCQFQPFNSIYQLYHDKVNGRLDEATDFLMIPEYLMYKLTGIKVHEYTNATTTGMINAKTSKYDNEIIDILGLKKDLFYNVSQPKTILGPLKESVANIVNGNCDVVLCATHDTGSAVAGISMNSDDMYISSGTWSLLGVKTVVPITTEESCKSNFSNEGGIGYNRYQKNIMGMWLVNRLKDELCDRANFNDVVDASMISNFEEIIDANSSELLSPKSMKDAFDSLLYCKPTCNADYFRCAYRSLAECYKTAIHELENNTGKKYKNIYIVGGGANNSFLNNLTELSTGKQVIALPIEATAIGNLKVQMEVIK